ncbi:MspA family porin [Gordonia polyisoprenivorans]|uniref:MspA family porin n=1 Tax=Gordonia polyisoprenivorans TaxID=84595 RepID=UPI001AD6C2EE|nr:MspA family porin [Gordonia polyisoprenivorans]QTI71591.1 MspA family porin [Gordonia polyisoprenivorans]
MKKISTRRAIAAAGVVGAALMGLTSLGAGGAVAGPLPGAKVVKKLVDGTPVSIQLYDESADVHPAVTNIATSREVFVSGKIRVTVGGQADGGTISAGYIVGCQLNFGGSAGADGSAAPDSGGGVSTSASASGGFTLGPGQAVFVPTVGQLVSLQDSSDNRINANVFSGTTGGVAYSQEKFSVDGCAGYAQAMAKVQVTVETDSVKGVLTAYGKPFSIG